MRRLGLFKTFGAVFAAALAATPVTSATEGAPLGAWRTTNECFLAGFFLTADGRAQTAYLTGELDDNAAWSWDGNTLKITSKTFDLDSFSGRLANGHVEADYVWHDMDTDMLNKQSCVFEPFTPTGI